MRVGFVGVRFAGLDGVSLEAHKIADVMREAGHEITWFAGELSHEFAPGLQYPPARFDTPDNLALQSACFGVDRTAESDLALIADRADLLEAAISDYITDGSIDILVPQNALSIPMQLPLAVALARIAKAGQPMLAHHHDFLWERDRFFPNGVESVLKSAFPPKAPSLNHLVINSIAQRELAARMGIDSVVLPNVMDFENPPPLGNGDAFRRYAGLGSGDVVLLQATRLIPRKSIELTLDLAAQLNDRTVRVVATHPDLDEGDEYSRFLERRADELNVDYRVAAVGGEEQPSLADAYAAADLVCYPSRIEGFGNGLLEAVYFGCPVLVNRYPVYVSDIEPLGFDAIEIDSEITGETVDEVHQWLSDRLRREAAAAVSYRVATEHFSYEAVRRIVLPMIEQL